MKKIMLLLVVSMFVFSACCFTSAPIMGTFVTDVEAPGVINEDLVYGNMVEGRAMASGILGVVSGDCSYETALKNALKEGNAKSLKNIVVDYKVKNILGIFAEYTTIVRGVPVR